MRRLLTAVVLCALPGCAGLLRAPAAGRPPDRTAEDSLVEGMNLAFLGPAVRRVEIEVDAVEGWAPGDLALSALQAELRHWVRPEAEIVLRVDRPIPSTEWTAAMGGLARAMQFIGEHGDPAAEDGITQLHVVYVPRLSPWSLGGAFGVSMRLPHGPDASDLRSTLLLATEPIRKVAALWIGPHKVERNVLVHELGHTLGLVSDRAHGRREDPLHCTVSSCLMVPGMDRRAMIVGAPRAIFLGRLPDAYCAACRKDLEQARSLYAARVQDSAAWASLQAQRARDDRLAGLTYRMECGEADAAAVAAEALVDDPMADVETLRMAAWVFRGVARWEESLAAARRVDALNRDGRYEMSLESLLALGRWSEVIEETERLRAKGTDFTWIEAWALLGAGRVEEGDARLRALQNNDEAPLHFRLWQLRERLRLWRAAGDPQRAWEVLQSSEDIDLTKNPSSCLEQARVLLATSREKEARQLLEPLARPRKRRRYEDIGRAARARALLGDAGGALHLLNPGTARFYGAGDLAVLRAEVLTTLGRPEAALNALETARAHGVGPWAACLNPDFAALWEHARFQALYRCPPRGNGTAGPLQDFAEKSLGSTYFANRLAMVADD